jgi:hypothetical protein
MSLQSVIPAPPEQSLPDVAADIAQELGIQLASFLFPLLVALDNLLDKRLVRTFLGSIQSILTFRDRIHGLLLTELGAALLSPDQEGAGTKRLASLIHSPKWSSHLIDAFLWSWATSLLEGMVAVGQEVYAIWDESVWEKPETIKREDLGPVRGSQSASLNPCQTRLLPPTSPHFCPWSQLVRGDPGRSATKGRRPLPGSAALVEQSGTTSRSQAQAGSWLEARIASRPLGAGSCTFLTEGLPPNPGCICA